MKNKTLLAISIFVSLLVTGCTPYKGDISPKFESAQSSDTFDVWDGSVATSFASGQGTSKNPYVISNAKELAYLQTSLSSKSFYSGSYISLKANIDLNNLTWNGIGEGTSAKAFKGIFLGNNFTIKNVNMNGSERMGFFRSTSGTIQDLNVEGSLTGGSSNKSIFGLLVGINYGSIINCTSKGNVNVQGIYVGGLIGCNAGGNIEDCSYLFGEVKGTNCVGGIIGYNMVSSGKIGSLDNCINYGHIYASDYAMVNYSGIGGIIGVCGSGASITKCVNHGNIIGSGLSLGGTAGIVGHNFDTTINNCFNYGNVVAKENVAGIVGYAQNSNGYITNCENFGKITGCVAVAGISGYNRTSITSCKNHGEIHGDASNISYWIGGIAGMVGSNVSIVNCINNGFVKGLGSSKGGVGGIAGSNYASIIRSCINNGLVEGLYRVGGILGYAQNAGSVVQSCINNGVFKSIATYGTISLGGIVGYNLGSVIYCTNEGDYLLVDNHECEMYGYIIGYDTVGSSKVYGNTNNA